MWNGLKWNGLKGLMATLPRLPRSCLLCSQPGADLLCPGCEFDLPYLARHDHQCLTCALPLSVDSRYCGYCLQAPPDFERCRVLGIYDYPLDHLVHAFKYRHKLASGRALSGLLAGLLRAEREEEGEETWPELLVPVPMHWTRRLKRGFNQTELLAHDLGRALSLPVLSRVARRPQPTRAQQGLTRTARIHNLSHAFSLNPRTEKRLAGRRVALIDDVVTTTSTVRALSRLIREAGARSVEVWALARTPESPQAHQSTRCTR
ncbi:ComF family protein [Marinimicrobium koreense]|uniref:ComF family protein n=1 Tax=Marinimicrobium koreense TaxID=306545 RepID=A0A3N1P0H4_9GAMM|nr:ComF family protein [Marinimicrobium koreense]ROQ21108.1 ComF family protein [Marinimicrobium koreense]